MPNPFYKCLILLLFSLSFFACQNSTTTTLPDGTSIEMSAEEYMTIAADAYLYGYPLILSDLTKRVITNVEASGIVSAKAPINQIGHFRRFPDHTLTAVVKPNVDTYYSIAWMDLKAEPMVLHMPATERYYLLPMLDAYSNVFIAPGTRTTGTEEQNFIIAGPEWKGVVPDSLSLIQAPTNTIWMLGRIQVNSPEDGATVVKEIQDGMRLIPLSAYGSEDYVATKGSVKEENNLTPVKVIQDLSTEEYFSYMAKMMAENPPPAADSAMVARMEKIGIIAGQPYESSTDNMVLKLKMKAIPSVVHQKFNQRRSNPDPERMINNWMFVTEELGKFGTNYPLRAYVDYIGFGVNWPEDAIYPNTTKDADGNPLNGSHTYVLHFDKSELPPVNAFWSLTAYNEEEFLIKNEINRYALGDRDDLEYNVDGSLDIFIQAERPEEGKMKNWLPVPKDAPFSLTMRLYWPKEEVLKREWNIPFVRKI